MGRSRGTKASKQQALLVVPVKKLNRRLAKLRSRAIEAEGAAPGELTRKLEAARVRWSRLKRAGCKRACCGKSVKKMCSSCPRAFADLVMAPLGARKV